MILQIKASQNKDVKMIQITSTLKKKQIKHKL